MTQHKVSAEHVKSLAILYAVVCQKNMAVHIVTEWRLALFDAIDALAAATPEQATLTRYDPEFGYQYAYDQRESAYMVKSPCGDYVRFADLTTPQPAEPVAFAWECNECGAQEFTSAVSESDLDYLACAGCGCDELHRVCITPPTDLSGSRLK